MNNVDNVPLSIARKPDVPRLPWLLTNYPDLIRVVSVESEQDFPLTDLISAPFRVTHEGEGFVLYAHDAKTGELARLQIASVGEHLQVLQYCNHQYKEWGDSPASKRLRVPAVTLYGCYWGRSLSVAPAGTHN